jgi:glycosyltransferase involved in cell wall biosynthesis
MLQGVQPAGHHIVCIGFADWSTDHWTNQHHLMARLATGNRVLFVESLGLRRPQLAGRDARRMLRRLRRGLRPPRAVDGLHVLSPLVVPLHDRDWIGRLNAALLRRQVRAAVRRLRIERPVLWSYVPQAEALVDVLAPDRIVYHCVDDIAAQKGVSATAFREAERRFASRADLVLASAPALAARMRTLNAHVVDAPNVADTALFATALEPGSVDAELDRLARPRIVFCGAVVPTKVDLRLVRALAEARPDWSIALVGAVGLGDPSTDVSLLRGVPNLHLLGRRPYDRLPEILRGADVAIIPYVINELTRSVFPMKVYEYLAAGLPVVSTPLPALAGLEDIAFARDATEMVHAVQAALEADDPAQRRARSARASEHSWDRRLAELAREL